MQYITDDQGYNQVFKLGKAMEVRTERRAQRILDVMAVRPPQAILELGSGTGELSGMLAARTGARVVGTDICQPFIQSASEKYRRPNLTYKHLDVMRSDVREQLGQTFDYIVGNGILHHLYHRLDEVLPRLKSLLNPHGRLIFWEPNLTNPYVYLIFTFPRLRRRAKLDPEEMAFTHRRLARVFRKAGYQDLDISYRDFLVPNTPDALIRPVVWASDLVERVPFLQAWAQSLFISVRP